MKKLFKSKLFLQVVVASMVATLATAGFVGAATTIGSNVNTGGTLTATGAATIYGATSVGGALTATSTLAVTGVTTLTGNLILSTASSTGLVKVDSLQLGTVAITSTGTELNYVDGVTSAIQTQMDLKSPLASPTFTGTAIFAAASSTGLVKVDSLQLGTVLITPTGTELNFVSGVTSAIQTQMDLKSPLASPTFTGTVILPTTTLGGVASSTQAGVGMKLNGLTVYGTVTADSFVGALTGNADTATNATAATSATTATNLASGVAGSIPYQTGAGATSLLAIGTANQVLQVNAGATAPEWTTFIASLGNTSAWTAAQKLDAGITVDTTNFTVSGTTGAVATASTLDVTGLTTATGGFTSVATTTLSGRIQGVSPLIFDGTTANDGVNVLTVSVTDPTAAQSQTLQNNTGVIPLGSVGNTIFFTTTNATNVTLPTTGTLSALGGTNVWTGTNAFNNTVNFNGFATTTTSGIISPGLYTADNEPTCDATVEGGFTWNRTTKIVCVCDGSLWVAATSTNGSVCGF